jgi:hypothetical protein
LQDAEGKEKKTPKGPGYWKRKSEYKKKKKAEKAKCFYGARR